MEAGRGCFTQNLPDTLNVFGQTLICLFGSFTNGAVPLVPHPFPYDNGRAVVYTYTMALYIMYIHNSHDQQTADTPQTVVWI